MAFKSGNFMAVKKSDLYSSLWASCDELRGGMDASQHKDYVLFMLFIKYVSDKYGDSDAFAPPIAIPKGASFKDMVALKGKSYIGDRINTHVIQPLIDANSRLARSDFPDFNDPYKLGERKERVEKLSNLIAIFENPALDFSKNRAEHDDILRQSNHCCFRRESERFHNRLLRHESKELCLRSLPRQDPPPKQAMLLELFTRKTRLL